MIVLSPHALKGRVSFYVLATPYLDFRVQFTNSLAYLFPRDTAEAAVVAVPSM